MRLKDQKIFELEKIIKNLKKKLNEDEEINNNLLKQLKNEKNNWY